MGHNLSILMLDLSSGLIFDTCSFCNIFFPICVSLPCIRVSLLPSSVPSLPSFVFQFQCFLSFLCMLCSSISYTAVQQLRTALSDVFLIVQPPCLRRSLGLDTNTLTQVVDYNSQDSSPGMDTLNGMPVLDVATVATPWGKLDKHGSGERKSA